MSSGIRKIIPRQIKEAVKGYDRERKLGAALQRISALPEGEVPPRELLAEAGRAWGEDGFRAVGGYFEEVARRAATTTGPVLEIGSGLTTLILGALAGRRGVAVWTLEHLPQFYEQTLKELERHDVGNVRLRLAPLREYGDFSWYDAPLDEMPDDFRLVIADGPPGDTKGGRFGLLPVMRAHLSPDAVVLLDDAEREDEQKVLGEWSERFGLSHETHLQDGKGWAVCTFSGAPPARERHDQRVHR